MRRGRAATSRRAARRPWSRGGARRRRARIASRAGRGWYVRNAWPSPERERVGAEVAPGALVEEGGELLDGGYAAEEVHEGAVRVGDGVGRQRDAAGELELIALEVRPLHAVVGPELERDEVALDALGDLRAREDGRLHVAAVGAGVAREVDEDGPAGAAGLVEGGLAGLVPRRLARARGAVRPGER